MAYTIRQLKTLVAILDIFSAASRLFKRSKSSFYLSIEILN